MRFVYNLLLVLKGDEHSDDQQFSLFYILCSLVDGLSFMALLLIHYRNLVANGHPIPQNQLIEDEQGSTVVGLIVAQTSTTNNSDINDY